ncbi:class I SAM-dependent methyltransferase [Ghiorsea bivora]|uniref:class I SAM-dependent methyltransferase n=1 Tax=Ghiorsea bivora TaxID=1485545 RepID=UPI000691F861|nr:SAM-dependent methyltransferase [Ghiorsea bivora]
MNNEHQRLYALTEHILALMQTKGGAISFHDWMQAALYQPKLGYYESERIFGKEGDFTTATAMGDWLSLGFAESINKAWHTMGEPSDWTLLEQGGGNGDLLCNTLTQLKQQGLFPSQIIAVETSEQLRQRQANNFSKHEFNIQQHANLEDINPIENLIMFSNELPDAFPVQTFSFKQQQTIERGVDWDGGKFIWTDLQTINTAIPQHIQTSWTEEYISEFNPNLQPWQQAISHIAQRAVVLTVDYGYTQKEYYRPARIGGTLMGHYQHQVVDDVLKLSPGVCDITTHVDFTALKKSGESVGLKSIAYTTQGAWLAESKAVQDNIQKLAQHPSVENIAQITHAKRLMLPTGMGESFKLLIQGKGLDETSSQSLISPSFDRLHTL